MSNENATEQNLSPEKVIEQKVAATPFKRDVTPYEIAKYLKVVLEINVSSQYMYRLVKTGKIPAYRENNREDGKWFVKKADAAKAVVSLATGSSKNVNPAW